MHKTTYPVEARENETVIEVAAVVGAGASAPTIPNSHKHIVASVARSGVGVFIITLKDIFPSWVGPLGQPAVVGTNGRKAFITAFDADDGTIAIATKDAADAAVDIATTDTLYVAFLGRNSKVKYGEAG